MTTQNIFRIFLALTSLIIVATAQAQDLYRTGTLVTSGGLVQGAIYKINPAGVESLFVVTGLSVGSSMVFDTSGNLFVCSTGNNGAGSILKITPSGVVTTYASAGGGGGIALPYHGPSSIAFDKSGNLYGNCGDSIVKISPTGAVSALATIPNPYGGTAFGGLAFDANENLFATYIDLNLGNSQANAIMKITPSGVMAPFVSGFAGPNSLAFDNQGNLYCNNVNFGFGNIINKITTSGLVSAFITGQEGAGSLVFDSNQNLVASVGGPNLVSAVVKISPSGIPTTFVSGVNGALAFGPTISTASAPEPCTVGLLLIGLFSLTLRRRAEGEQTV